MSDVQQTIKQGVDVVAVSAVAGSMIDLLPPIAAGFSIVWIGMQIIVSWPKFRDRLKEIFKR